MWIASGTQDKIERCLYCSILLPGVRVLHWIGGIPFCPECLARKVYITILFCFYMLVLQACAAMPAFLSGCFGRWGFTLRSLYLYNMCFEPMRALISIPTSTNIEHLIQANTLLFSFCFNAEGKTKQKKPTTFKKFWEMMHSSLKSFFLLSVLLITSAYWFLYKLQLSHSSLIFIIHNPL